LCDAAGLRIRAREAGVSEVHEEQEGLLIYFRTNFQLPEAAFKVLVSAKPEILSFIAGPPPGVRVSFQSGEGPLDTLGRFLRLLAPAAASPTGAR
jgi:hypothetical protein